MVPQPLPSNALFQVALTHKNPAIQAAVLSKPSFFVSMVSHVRRFVFDASSSTPLEECAAHACSMLQVTLAFFSALACSVLVMWSQCVEIADWSLEQMTFSAAASSTSSDQLAACVAVLTEIKPVQTLLRCVATLIGRAVLDERLLSCLLMQTAVGALANLAQQEQVGFGATEHWH